MKLNNTKNNILSKSIVQYFLLTILLCVIATYYDYFSLMCSIPTGTHIWRQTDSASFAWTYWQNGLDFFHPQIMNRAYGNGYAVSEFPIVQYFIAILYSIFGFHWFLSKAVYLLLYLGGIYAIFYITSTFVKDKFWSFFLAILFFAAPGLVFYGNSCIPDVPALLFSLIGVAFYLKKKKNGRLMYLWISTIFFCLAGLMKMTYLITFVALLCTEIIACYFSAKKQQMPFRFKIKYLLPLLFLFIMMLFWWWYMKEYNNINQQSYFLTKTNPYWNSKLDSNT